MSLFWWSVRDLDQESMTSFSLGSLNFGKAHCNHKQHMYVSFARYDHHMALVGIFVSREEHEAMVFLFCEIKFPRTR